MIKVMMMPIKKSGGPGIFMHRLMNYMQEHEMVQWADETKEPDVYISTVWRGKPPKGCKVIYRAASAYYNAHDKKRRGLNKKLGIAIRAADHVVYQTNFARKLCEKVLGRHLGYKVKAKQSSIISNGFNMDQYNDIKPDKKEFQHVFVACSNWTTRVKRGEVIVRAFRKAKISNSQLIMIGEYHPKKMSLKKKYIITNKIKMLGAQPITKIISTIKSASAFVHLSYVETCPNAVIESLSCGCPVICNNIGGTPEIVQDSGIIAKCDAPFIFRRRPVDIAPSNMNTIIDAFRNSVNTEWDISRDDLSMSICADKYKQVFEEVLS